VDVLGGDPGAGGRQRALGRHWRGLGVRDGAGRCAGSELSSLRFVRGGLGTSRRRTYLRFVGRLVNLRGRTEQWHHDRDRRDHRRGREEDSGAALRATPVDAAVDALEKVTGVGGAGRLGAIDLGV
jgi:hypothetical protein